MCRSTKEITIIIASTHYNAISKFELEMYEITEGANSHLPLYIILVDGAIGPGHVGVRARRRVHLVLGVALERWVGGGVVKARVLVQTL